MAPRNDSLTSNSGASSASTVSAGNHFAADSSKLSPIFKTHSLSTHSLLFPVRCSFDVPSTRLLATQLIDYSSSEEETGIHQVQLPEKREPTTRKKQEAKEYKSAKFVDSESDGSDAVTSDHHHRPRTKFSRTLTHTTHIKKAGAWTIPDMMNRMDSLTWGASASTKRRPLPSSAPSPLAKRPKQGPFVVDSSSEDDGGSDNNDGFNVDGHITLAPEQPTRSGMGENHPLYDSGNDIIRARMRLQRQGSDKALEGQAPTSKTSTPRPNRALNKDRLKMLMAKKQGRAAAPSMKLESPLPVSSAQTNLRTRPLNAAQAGASRQDIQSPATWPTPLSLQGGRLGHTVQGKTPDRADSSLQAYRSQTQDPGPIHVSNTQARTQRSPASAPNSTTLRKIITVRPQNGANSSSLRNVLDTAKAEQHSAAKELDNIGSEWRKAQVERASAKPVKNAHRPEVGARYGHTLTARKSNPEEKGSASTKGAPATTGVKAFRTPISWSRAASAAATPYSDVKNTLKSGSKDPLAPNITPLINRTSVNDLRHPTRSTRQSTVKHPTNQGPVPTVSSKQTQLAPDTPVEQTNDTARLGTVDAGKRWTPSLSLATSDSSLQNGEVTLQETVTPTLVNSISSQVARPQSCVGLVSRDTIHTREDQQDHSPHTGLTGSRGKSPAQQAATQKPDFIFTKSNSPSQATGAKGLELQKTSVTRAALQSGRSVEPINADTHEKAPNTTAAINRSVERPVAVAPDISDIPSASAEPGAEPRIPVAVMVRPERLGVQSLRRNSASKTPPLVASVIDTNSNKPETVSGTTECLHPWSDKHGSETDEALPVTAPLALNKDEEPLESEASEPMEPGSDRSGSCSLEQGPQTPVRTPLDDFVSEHTPVGPTGRVEVTSSRPVDDPHDRPTPSALSTPMTLQTATLSPELQNMLPGANAECIQLWSNATTVPSPITTEDSKPQPAATLTDSTNAVGAPTKSPVPTATAQSSTLSLAAATILPSPTISPTAEAYFEYSIHQSLSSLPSSTTTAEISAQPVTALDNANTHTGKLFQNAKEQYEILGMTCKSMNIRFLDGGLSVHEGTFASIEDPSKTVTLKLWVERAEVGVHANHTPSPSSITPLISKTLYALRLWKLAEAASDSESDSDSDSNAEDEDEDDIETVKGVQIRIYHPLPRICTEIYTSLDAANRAARRVQIELSHEKEPKQPLQRQWQTQNLFELNRKLEELRREVDEGGDESGSPSLFEYEEGRRRGCWRSVFDGVGCGAEKFEVLVTSVKLSGPRNL